MLVKAFVIHGRTQQRKRDKPQTGTIKNGTHKANQQCRWAIYARSVVSVIVIAITEPPVPSRKVNKHELPIVDRCLSVFW